MFCIKVVNGDCHYVRTIKQLTIMQLFSSYSCMLVSDMDVVLTKFKADSLILSKYTYCRFNFILSLLVAFFGNVSV